MQQLIKKLKNYNSTCPVYSCDLETIRSRASETNSMIRFCFTYEIMLFSTIDTYCEELMEILLLRYIFSFPGQQLIYSENDCCCYQLPRIYRFDLNIKEELDGLLARFTYFPQPNKQHYLVYCLLAADRLSQLGRAEPVRQERLAGQIQIVWLSCVARKRLD